MRAFRHFLTLLACLLCASVALALTPMQVAILNAVTPSWVPMHLRLSSLSMYIRATQFNPEDGTFGRIWIPGERFNGPLNKKAARTASGGTAIDASGNLNQFVGNALRETSAGLLTEPSSSNQIRNSTNQGAGPGVFPTNWINGSPQSGVSVTPASPITTSGYSCLPLTFSGTATSAAGANLVTVESYTQIAALTGQTWTFGLTAYAIGVVPPLALDVAERTNTGISINDHLASNATLTNAPTRLAFSVALNGGATTAFINARLIAGVTNGQAYSGTWFVCGAQVEQQPFATSFIPTTSGAVTRLQDGLAFNDNSFLSQGAGTLLVGFTPEGLVAASNTLATIDDGTGSNKATIATDSPAVHIVGLVVAGGAQSGSTASLSGYAAGSAYKSSFAYGANDRGLAVNQVAATRQTGASTVPSMSVLRLGSGLNGVLPAAGLIGSVAFFNADLPDAQNQAVTR